MAAPNKALDQINNLRAEVRSLGATLKPGELQGEAVGIAVVTREGHARPDEAELKELIRSRLRSSRVPEKVLFVDALPYNEMGKLLRREVRTLFSR